MYLEITKFTQIHTNLFMTAECFLIDEYCNVLIRGTISIHY